METSVSASRQLGGNVKTRQLTNGALGAEDFGPQQRQFGAHGTLTFPWLKANPRLLATMSRWYQSCRRSGDCSGVNSTRQRTTFRQCA